MSLKIFFKTYKQKKPIHSRTRKLRMKNTLKRDRKNPQLKSVVAQLRIVTPKKPNSARRQCAKAFLTNYLYTVFYIRGSGHNLRKFSEALIQGGGARDLPGIRYHAIRNVLGLSPIHHKIRRRSIYGVRSHFSDTKKMRKKFRKIFS